MERKFGLFDDAAAQDSTNEENFSMALGVIRVWTQSFARPETYEGQLVAENPNPLTKSEQEVFKLLANGLTELEISNKRITRSATTKSHLSQIYNKLSVPGQLSAILTGVERGVIAPVEIGSALDFSRVKALTPRHIEVLSSYLDHANSRTIRQDIADVLCISLNTLAMHNTHIFKILAVQNSTQAVLIYLAAQRDGVI